MFDISTLITDRTQADVQAWNDKGTYNPSDLNRVTHAMEYLVERIRSYGYTVRYEKVKVPHIHPNPTVNSSTEIDIPAGRMRGDIDGDGYISNIDRDMGDAHIKKEVILTDETQLLCLDVTGDGVYNTMDVGRIYSMATGSIKYGRFALDITNTWTPNSNYATEEAQFYIDLPVDVTAGADFTLLTETEQTRMFAEVYDGFVRVFATAVPIAPLKAKVSVSREVGEYEWCHSDIPQERELTAYLQNVKWLREAMVLHPNTPEVPADMQGFTFAEANDIEQILVNIETIINLMLSSIIYSGEIFSGEVI